MNKPTDGDKWQTAKLLVDHHGETASIFAAMEADARLEAGDLDEWPATGLVDTKPVAGHRAALIKA